MNHAEEYEFRRGLFLGGGGLGGILGGLLGTGLDFLVPGAGIPLALASGLGSGLGGFAQGAISGEPIGKAAVGGLESGGISAALAGLGEGLTTGNVLAAPGAAATGPLGNLFGSAGATAGDVGTGVAGTAPVAPVTAAPLSAGGAGTALAPGAATGGAPAAGPGAGASVSGIGGTTGAVPGDVSGALSTTPAGGGGSYFMGGLTNDAPPSVTAGSAPATLTQNLGTTGPVGGSSLVPSGGTNLVTGLPSTPDEATLNAAPNTNVLRSGTTTPLTGSQVSTAAAGGDVLGGGNPGSKIMSYLAQNPGLLLAGGGLAEALFKGNSTPGLPALQTEASLEATQGNQNMSALQTGQLPAGAQAAIDQAERAAKATTASNFARLGMTGSTSEAQSEAGIEQAAAAQKFGDLSQVSQLGLQQLGAANSLYTTIMNTQLAQDKETQDAIARLAAALGGSTGARAATAAP